MTVVHSATYSPEDNKIRIYPACKLGSENYDILKAAGYIWAPKQELFVAPAWSPEREDVAIALCGEIGDEDTSLVSRAEERAERFEDYSESRLAEAEAVKAGVDAITDGIPLGQPILVGHHSEKHARKNAEKIKAGCAKAVKLWETSKYWTDRAAGAVYAAKYKELPAVRARRIKTLSAELRKHQKSVSEATFFNKLWKASHKKDGTEIILDKARAMAIANQPGGGGEVFCIDGSKCWSAWSALDADKITPEEARLQCTIKNDRLIAWRMRHVNHLTNRLAYENAMMAECGGTVADKTKPEKGGACRCWATSHTHGAWSLIRKVNKVSVTIKDTWGPGRGDFTRTISFDKLTAVMPKAEVERAKTEGRLHWGAADNFFLDGPEASVSEAFQQAAEAGAECYDKNAAAGFCKMKEMAKTEVKVVVADQLFATPPELAQQVVDLAEIGEGMTVLEPSAGTGALLEPLFSPNGTAWLGEPSGNTPGARLVVVERSHELCVRLRACYAVAQVNQGDFLESTPTAEFDRIIMNPPFKNGSDIKHVLHALKFLKPGGRCVAIVANGPRQQDQLKPMASQWIDLPAGTFAEQGTNVNAAIAVFEADL